MQVYNVAPSLALKSPPEFGTVTTNRPFLVVSGTDTDGYPAGAVLTYDFRVCRDAALTVDCQTSGWTTSTSWQPPTQLLWGSSYYWTATVSDGVSSLSALNGHPDGYKFTVVVPAADDWRQVGNGLGLANAFGVVLPYGVFVHTERDAEVSTVNVPLAIDRTFSSGAVSTEGAFGNGWMSIFDTAYVKQSADLYRITYTDGRQETFGRNPNGEFIGRVELGLSNRLTIAADGAVKVTQLSGENLHFNSSGRLTRVEYPELGSWEFAYSNGNITTITQQPSGRQIRVEWSLTGQSCSASSRPTRPYVSAVSVDVGLSKPASRWSYAYSCRRLSQVSDPLGQSTTYASAGLALNATSPTGVKTAGITYDSGWQTPNSGAIGAQRRQLSVGEQGTVNRTISVYKMNTWDGAAASYLQNYNEWGGPVVSHCETRINAYPETCTGGVPLAMRFDTLNRMRARGWSQADQASVASVERLWIYDVDGPNRGRLTSMRDENGSMVGYGYDGWGNLNSTRMYRSDGTQVTSTNYFLPYGGPGTPTRVIGSVISPTQAQLVVSGTEFADMYFYDGGGRLIRREGPPTPGAPLGEITSYTYTSATTPAVDGSGTAIPGQYAPAGLLRSETVGPKTTTYSYDARGDRTLIADSDGSSTLRSYDNRGLVISETVRESSTASGATTHYERDALGRVIAKIFPCVTNAVTGVETHKKVSYLFDADGRPSTTTQSAIYCENGAKVEADRTTTISYTARGQVASQTNALGGVTTFTYSEYNPDQVSSIRDTRGRYSTFGYTDRGNHVKWVRANVGDALNPSTERVAFYEYDNAGRVISEYDALSRQTTYQYTTDGHVSAAYRGGVELWRRSYDGAGNMISELVGGRQRTDYVYDAEGRVSTLAADPTGVNRTVTTVRDTFGRVVGNIRAAGGIEEKTTFQLDSSGNVISTSVHLSPGVALTSLSQTNALGLVTSMVDPRGQLAGASANAYRTTQTFDELNRLTRIVAPAALVDSPANQDFTGVAQSAANAVSELGYNAFGELTEVVNPSGLLTMLTYDSGGNVVLQRVRMQTNGAAQTTVTAQNVYSTAGDLLQSTDPRGGVTNYSYDIAGNRTREQAPLVSGERPTTLVGYDRANQVTSTTAPTGAVIRFTYDVFGRVVAKSEQERRIGGVPEGGFITSYSYDAAGNVLTVTSPASRVTRNEYNAVGELTAVFSPGVSNPTRYFYDVAGRIVKETNPYGTSIETTYDRAGRVTSTANVATDGSRLVTSFTYDANGNMVSSTDPRGTTTTFSVDAANRRTAVVQPVSATLSIRTEAGYDPAGNRVRTRDGRGYDTWTQYDQRGAITRIVEPVTPADPALVDRSWSFEYDNALNQVSQISPGGTEITRTYDALNRLTAEVGHQYTASDPPAASRHVSYDAAGNVTSATSSTGSSQTFEWSDRGKIISSSGTAGSSSFGYDPDGLLTQRLEAFGGFNSTTIAYNAAGQEISYSDQIIGSTLSSSYSATTGELTGRTWTGGSMAATYDPFGRVATTTVKNASNANVQKISYGYDSNSNTTSKRIEGGVLLGGVYQYDLADRLTSWSPIHPTGPIGSIYPRQYRWDNSGNTRLAQTINIFSQQWNYDARNRLTGTNLSWDGDDFEYSIESSPAGQVTYLGDSNRYLTYDALGQLIGDKATTYTYDGLGRLASRTIGTSTQQFAYAGTSTQPYRAPSSTTASENVGRTSTGSILSSSFGPRIALTDSHGDILGGIGVSGAATGSLLSSVGYEPFGEKWSGSALPSQQRSAFGFQGSWTDSQTGSVWMGTRWYDPGIGSFLSRDDTRFDFTGASALNLFGYGNGNPIKYVDPDGRYGIAAFVAGLGLSAVQGAVIGALLVGSVVAASYTISELANGRDVFAAYSSGLSAGVSNVVGAAATAHRWAVDVNAYVANSTFQLMSEFLKFSFSALAAHCYIFLACDPRGGFGGGGGGGGGREDSSAAPTAPRPAPDTTIDFTQTLPQLRTVVDGAIGVVTSLVAGSMAAGAACGLTGTLQSCILPGATVPSACAGANSPAGLCTPTRPVPNSGSGSGATAPVKPITEGAITTTAGLAAAMGIALSIGAPQGPNQHEDDCLPDPEGSDEGIVYERIDTSGNLKPYIGQAKGDPRYADRKGEHARGHPDSDFDFTIIDRAKPGEHLDRAEQRAITARGGPTNLSNPDGGLSNKRNQVSEKRCNDFEGGC